MNNNKDRLQVCKDKFIFNKDEINNNKIILIDDSIVRGITMKYIIILLKEYGAKEIHIRIASPPIKNQCYYGVDIPTQKELIAHDKSIEDIKDEIGATTLKYLSIKSLNKNENCTACFDGDYNTDLIDIEDLL